MISEQGLGVLLSFDVYSDMGNEIANQLFREEISNMVERHEWLIAFRLKIMV